MSMATAPSTRRRARFGCRTSPTMRHARVAPLVATDCRSASTTRTGRVLGTDDLHRAFVGESLRVLPVKIAGRCLFAVAYALVAAFSAVVAAVLAFGSGFILVSVLAGTALAIRDGNLGDALRMSVVVGPPV